MDQISVMIVDDHTIFCEGLKRVLDSRDDFKVVSVARNGYEAVQKAEELLPSIILMDVEMPRLGGIEATRIIKKRFPFITVIMLTMHAKDKFWLESRQAGASGYVIKDAAIENLYLAIAMAKEKCGYSNHEVFMTFPDSSKKSTLTSREQEVLSLVAIGYTNKEIAESLFVSMHTVKNHMTNIFTKLKCSNRAEAITHLFDDVTKKSP